MKLNLFLTDKQVTEIVIGNLGENGKRKVEVPLPNGFEPSISNLNEVQNALHNISAYLGTLGMDDAVEKIYEYVEEISNEILKVSPEVAKYE